MKQKFIQGTDLVLRLKRLGEVEWLEHGFGTRAARDWTRDPLVAKQVHGSKIIVMDERWDDRGPQSGDAMITNKLGFKLAVRTADCLPILVVDPVSRSIAAIHAGWRGTAQEIALKTIEKMASRYAADPDTMIAAIGPGIGACCYQVGPEVAKEFAGFNAAWAEAAEPVNLDLTEINRQQLIKAGLRERNVLTGAPCTKCDTTYGFHSYRRDGEEAGRMISSIGIMNKHQMRGPMYKALDQTEIRLD